MKTKNTNRILRVLFIFIALTSTIIYGEISCYGQPAKGNGVEKIISPEHMSEDLDYLVQKIKNVHPATYKGFNQQQKSSIDATYKQILEPIPTSQFFFIASSIIASLNDAHSTLLMNGNEGCIDVPIISLNDGFYIRQTTEHFQKGDKIISFGNMTIDDIFNKLRNYIPAENDQWKKVKMGEFLAFGYTLDYLHLIENDSVLISISRNDVSIKTKAFLQSCGNINWWYSRKREPVVGYKIYPELSLGVIYIDECINNDYYRNTLHSFFSDVAEDKIKNIAVDLRRNGGGHSSVIQEFLSYFDINKYKNFGALGRFSRETKEATGDKRERGTIKKNSGNFPNQKIKKALNFLFTGNLFVLTSAQTFSSSNMFATTIKDNSLGTIVGEPTGNAPSSFGDILEFKLPNSGFHFSVSYKKFIRPGKNNNPQDALYPDITIYTTGNDLLLDIDPPLEKIKNIINKH